MAKLTRRSTKRRFFRKFGFLYRPAPVIFPKVQRYFSTFTMTIPVLPKENAPFAYDQEGRRVRGLSDEDKVKIWGRTEIRGRVFFVDLPESGLPR